MTASEIALSALNQVRSNKGLPLLDGVSPSLNLRQDLGMDSLDLAELTVRIEKATSVDVFADGIVSTVGEILDRLHGHGIA